MPYNGGYFNQLPRTGCATTAAVITERGSVLSTTASINYWTQFNNTTGSPTTVNFTNIDTSDGSTAIPTSYHNGDYNSSVVLVKVQGGGHSSPSLLEKYSTYYEQYYICKQNHDIEMARQIWQFFKPLRK